MIFHIFCRALPCYGMENPAEIELIGKAHYRCNIFDEQIRIIFHDFFCLLNSQGRQMPVKAFCAVFSKQLAEIRLGNSKNCA